MADKINNNCQCPAVCSRHGNCKKCRAAQRQAGSQTYYGK